VLFFLIFCAEYADFYGKDTELVFLYYSVCSVLKAETRLKCCQESYTAATAMEDEAELDEAQALLDHSSAQTTKRYAHARLKKLKELARNRRNPFE